MVQPMDGAVVYESSPEQGGPPMADTPDPLKPAKIQGQNPNTPERMPGHTGFHEDGEADKADDEKEEAPKKPHVEPR
jgi:hypothetical protein